MLEVYVSGGNMQRIWQSVGTRLKGSSLLARAAKGTALLAAAGGFEQALRLARNMVLARVLAPEAFGTLALVLSVTSMFESLSEVGIREAVIQSPLSNDRSFVNAAWYLALGRGIALYVVGFSLAPVISHLYGSNQLLGMLRVAFISFLSQGAVSTRAYLSVKTLRLWRWTLVQQVAAMVGVASSIILSLWLHNAWGLVGGFVLEGVARTFISFLLFPFVPRYDFDRTLLKPLLKYMRRMMGIPLLTYVYLQVDVFVVARLLGQTQLGLYAMAAALSRLPDMVVSRFASPVAMPAFSELQNDKEAISKSLSSVTKVIGIVAIPLAVACALSGSFLMSTIYTEAYAMAGRTFGILLVASTLRNMAVPFAAICLSIARADLLRFVTGIRAIVAIALIVPLTRQFGAQGAAASILLAAAVAYVAQMVALRPALGARGAMGLTEIWWGIAVASPAALAYPLVSRAAQRGVVEGLCGITVSVMACYVAYGVYLRVAKRFSEPDSPFGRGKMRSS